MPAIYHSLPAEEDRYWLWRYGGELVRRDVLSVLFADDRPPLQKRRERSVKRALDRGVEFGWSDDYGPFWQLLASNLQQRHGVAPVHTVEEITLLASRFPSQIRLAVATIEDELLAGVVLYLSPRVCHVQYNAASDPGRQIGALDALLRWMLDAPEIARPHFDFGISTESGGTVLNEGLVEYKEGFGARCIVHDFYRVNLEPFLQ